MSDLGNESVVYHGDTSGVESGGGRAPGLNNDEGRFQLELE
jgi:hypothetical protein